MSSAAIATVIKMMESLPEAVQNQVVEHLRQYMEYLQLGVAIEYIVPENSTTA